MTAGSVLLVGGNGFLGQATARTLSAQGWRVGILSRGAVPDLPPSATWHCGCQANAHVVVPLLDQYGIIVHLASTSTPGTFADRPVLECEENLLQFLRFIEISECRPDLPVVYISSGGAVYGEPPDLPVVESCRLAPISNHAAGKAAAECFLSVQSSRGRRITVLRPSNIYGPGQYLKPGFGVIRTMLEHLRRGTAMDIWGNGESLRDYLYIDDFVSAMQCVVERPIAGTFNLGSGVGYSLNRLREIVERTTGRTLAVDHRPARPIDVKSVVLDSAVFRTAFEWAPTVGLEQGIGWTWQRLEAQEPMVPS